MQTITKRMFAYEYRAEAVKLVIKQGMGATEAAKKRALSVKGNAASKPWTKDEVGGYTTKAQVSRTTEKNLIIW